MTKTYNDPEHVVGVLNDEVYWLTEALWNYLHEPNDENLRAIEGSAKEVSREAASIANFVSVGHESMKGDIVDGE